MAGRRGQASGCAFCKQNKKAADIFITDRLRRPATGHISRLPIRLVHDHIPIAAAGQLEPGRGGEYQLTDALNTLATGGGEAPIFGVVFGGRRYDTGDRAEWIKANLLLGVEHAELGHELREWVIRFADRLRGAADSSGAE